VFEGPQLPPGFTPTPPDKGDKSVDKEGMSNNKSGNTTTSAQGEWFEAMSEMGYPYYWNTVTGGTHIGQKHTLK